MEVLNELQEGQTWVGISGNIRYRVLRIGNSTVKIYIYHGLNSRFNRIKFFREDSSIFNQKI